MVDPVSMNDADAASEFDTEVPTVKVARQTLRECAAEWAANWGQLDSEKDVDSADETR